MPAIETTALTKHFDNVSAVSDLNLTVEHGEAFGFLEPNGAGKSTTINLLLGLLSPTSGTASVLGHDVQNELKKIRQDIGVLAEGTAVYKNLTGRDHVRSAIQMKNVDDDPENKLAYVGLGADAWDRPAGNYSKGMQQRLGLAIALVGNPDLLILDEPTAGLDPTGVEEIREIMIDQVDNGRAVFFSSHLLPEVQKVCGRAGIMKDGQLVAIEDVSRLDETTTNTYLELEVTEIPAELERGIESISGIADVTTDGSSIRIQCTDRTVKIDAIKHVDSVTEIIDIIAESESLEAVFSSYTDDSTKPKGTA